MEDIIKAKAKENQGTRTDICQKSDKSYPIDSKKEIAKIAGVSHDTISKVKAIEKDASPEQKKELSEGKKKINTVWKEIKKLTKGDPSECAHLSWETYRKFAYRTYLNKVNTCLVIAGKVADTNPERIVNAQSKPVCNAGE